MTTPLHYPSTHARARQARRLAAAHYEPGNQARCLKQVWRRWALPEMGISYRTFIRYLSLPPENEKNVTLFQHS